LRFEVDGHNARVIFTGRDARVAQLQLLTDAALAHLELDDLLAALLDRTLEILDVDTCAVLLLDPERNELVARAAIGSDEDVDNGFGVPMHVEGNVIGVLHVGSLTPRQFTSSDVELLQLAGDRAAAAVQSMTAAADRAAVTALQRSLVPSALPAVAGAEMAARYIPGSGAVGGDWYDVFTLPAGQLCVTVGDVAGSGLAAAVIMGRMRSTLRAYALESADPSEVLGRLDRKMQHFEPDALATVVYAVIEPGLDQMHVALAGHFPPVIARPGQPAELADIQTGALIGVAPRARRPVTTVPFPPGALLCFYTDGLVERPGEVIDEGLDRLCQAVTAQSPEAACAAVMGAMVGSEPARDDIALLMIRHYAGRETDADA
jgi:serine phosphatase RsbU (regulator of sigma subunit)